MLETLEFESGGSPQTSIIVLHGLGADGQDFVPLASELDLNAWGAVRFIFPHAPVIPVTINGGYRMRAWYDIVATDLQRREDEAGLRASAQQIKDLIDRERDRGVAAERIILAGFSQGCAMSLMTGLRYPAKLAAIVGLSGYLPLAASTKAEANQEALQTPVFLAHGVNDEIVSVTRGHRSRALLQQLGVKVDWFEYPMGHQVCVEEIQDLNAWLLKVLGAPEDA